MRVLATRKPQCWVAEVIGEAFRTSALNREGVELVLAQEPRCALSKHKVEAGVVSIREKLKRTEMEWVVRVSTFSSLPAPTQLNI